MALTIWRLVVPVTIKVLLRFRTIVNIYAMLGDLICQTYNSVIKLPDRIILRLKKTHILAS